MTGRIPELHVPDGAEVTPAQMRAACIVLAGQALETAGGDIPAAAALLRQPLEAIGAIPHEPKRKTPWGNVPKAGGRGNRRPR